jgi:hypothetical protein
LGAGMGRTVPHYTRKPGAIRDSWANRAPGAGVDSLPLGDAVQPAANRAGDPQTLTACSRSASVSEVLRSVEALRSPMMSAQGMR